MTIEKQCRNGLEIIRIYQDGKLSVAIATYKGKKIVWNL